MGHFVNLIVFIQLIVALPGYLQAQTTHDMAYIARNCPSASAEQLLHANNLKYADKFGDGIERVIFQAHQNNRWILWIDGKQMNDSRIFILRTSWQGLTLIFFDHKCFARFRILQSTGSYQKYFSLTTAAGVLAK